MLLELARSEVGERREVAARAALEFSSDRLATAKEMLEIDDATVISIAVEGLDEASEQEVFEALVGLLGNDALGPRNVATRYLIRRLSRKVLQAVPNIYGRGQYYYSVQVLIDRALYAPAWAREAIDLIRGR